tara:strand:- start:2941 stop:3630 length:690 start_codon:yes stop_codon:yes gene_type:complete
MIIFGGCSFTQEIHNHYQSINFKKMELDPPIKKWPELFAAKINMPYINTARSGLDNKSIYYYILEQLVLQKDVKVVAVMWSGWFRERLYTTSFLPTAKTEKKKYSKTYLDKKEYWDAKWDLQQVVLKNLKEEGTFFKHCVDRTLDYQKKLKNICEDNNIVLIQSQGTMATFSEYAKYEPVHGHYPIKISWQEELSEEFLINSPWDNHPNQKGSELIAEWYEREYNETIN